MKFIWIMPLSLSLSLSLSLKCKKTTHNCVTEVETRVLSCFRLDDTPTPHRHTHTHTHTYMVTPPTDIHAQKIYDYLLHWNWSGVAGMQTTVLLNDSTKTPFARVAQPGRRCSFVVKVVSISGTKKSSELRRTSPR